MSELATALMGLFSASIFLAHAVDAYRARIPKQQYADSTCFAMRGLRPKLVESSVAEQQAKAFARSEQRKLNSQVCDHRGADVRSAWHVR
jgi:hypothetical protein